MFKKVLLAGALLLAPVLAYGGSPNTDLSVQIVPAASPKPPSNGIACGYGLNYTGTIPAAAQAMGFTTCAANYDFTQPFYATLSNWLDCAGASSPQWWIQPYITSGEAPCSAFSIVTDAGNNALDIHWDPSYFNGGNTRAAYIETANSGQTSGFFFPLNVYFEAKVRVPQASYNACNGSWCQISDLFTWTNPNIDPNALEWDIVEFGTDGGWASGGAPNYTGGASGSNPVAWQNQPTNGGTSNYNIYGNMINADSSGNLYQCAYLNNTEIWCSGNEGPITGPGASENLALARNWIKMGTGPTNSSTNFNNPADMYVEWIHVFSCLNYATQQCYTAGPAVYTYP